MTQDLRMGAYLILLVKSAASIS